VTLSDGVTVGEEAEAARYTASSGIQRGGARGRAKPSLAAAPLPVTDGDGQEVTPTVQERAQGFADALAARVQAKIGAAPPLAHAKTLSLAEGRDRVHASAAYQSVPVLRGARIAYGYLHLLWGLACDAAKEAPRSPWGLLIGAACVFILIHWL
jgi:hypothetical protein